MHFYSSYICTSYETKFNDFICSIVVDAIVHTSVKTEIDFDKTSAHRDFICDVLIQCVEKKYDSCCPLNKLYKLPRLTYIGYIDKRNGETVRKATDSTETCKQMVRATHRHPNIEEIKPSSPSSLFRSTQIKEDEKKKIKFGLFFLLSNEERLGIDDLRKLIHDLCVKDMSLPLSLFPFQIDSNMQFTLPLLFDPSLNSSLKVLRIEVIINISKEDVSRTKLEVSEGILHATNPKYLDSECILPFWIAVDSSKCTYNDKDSQLRFTAVVREITDCPDTGSHVWLLDNALSGDGTSKNRAKIGSHDGKIEKDELLDPYFLGLSHSECEEELEKRDLPEDQFHANDSLSLFNIQKQDDEIIEKTKRREDDRKLRVAENSDVELIDVDDFKPGGKHYDEKKETKSISKHIIEQNESLKKARELLKESGVSSFQNEYWMELF